MTSEHRMGLIPLQSSHHRAGCTSCVPVPISSTHQGTKCGEEIVLFGECYSYKKKQKHKAQLICSPGILCSQLSKIIP